MSRDTDLDALRLDGKTVDADVRQAVESATLARTIEGASTLSLTLRDPDRTLVRSRLFASRVTATVDGSLFELVQVRKSGSTLELTFEDAVVADLRRDKGVLTAKEGTTTVDAFVRRLVQGAPGAKLVAEPGSRNLVPLMRGSADKPGESSWEAITRLAEERGRRVFADRGVVYFASDAWLAKRSRPAPVREHDAGVDEVSFDADVGKRSQEATLAVELARWQAPPGSPVQVHDLGAGSGVWIVAEVRRSLFSTRAEVKLKRTEAPLPEPKPEPRDDGQPSSGAKAAAGGSVTAGPVSPTGYAWPVSGRFTSGYGTRGGRLHAGVDVAVPIGTPVGASRAGTVVHAGDASGYGTAVYLDHGGGHVTRYGHLSKVLVRRGQTVKLGERIGLSGNTGRSTGPHVHLELRVGGKAVDPLKYLPPRR